MTHHNELPIRSEVYGTTQDGQEVRRFILRNEMLQLSVIEYGATIENLVLTLNGKAYSVCHRFESLDAYESDPHCVGAVVGPVVNYEATYEQEPGTTTTHVPQSVHDAAGGDDGLHTMVWQGRAAIDHRGPCVELETIHLDGMNAERGNLYCRVRLVLGQNGVCHIEHEFLSDDARAINLAHHTYLRLPHIPTIPANTQILELNSVTDGHSRLDSELSFSSDLPRSESASRSRRLPMDELTDPSVQLFADNAETMSALAQIENDIVRVSVHSDQRALYLRSGSVAQSEPTVSVCLAPHSKGIASPGQRRTPFILEAGQLHRQKSEIRVRAI
jgi:galactose mutarotase-like enzyme